MSSDIYAKPDLSKKVRYCRKEQEDGSEWEQREVDIYESADVDHTQIFLQDGGPQTLNPPPVQKGSLRCVALGPRVLCLLILAGIITLSAYYILVTLEKKQLQDRNKVSRNCSLHDNQTHNSEKCPEGWSRFGNSCYFKSTERNDWERSRRDCLDKGADLVIINSKEEQKFISELNLRGESWIGLERIPENSSEKSDWKWVDGSALTEMFWATGLEDILSYYAVCCDNNGKWTSDYLGSKTWICEKRNAVL